MSPCGGCHVIFFRQSCIMNETVEISLWSFYIHSKKHDFGGGGKKVTMKNTKEWLGGLVCALCVCVHACVNVCVWLLADRLARCARMYWTWRAQLGLWGCRSMDEDLQRRGIFVCGGSLQTDTHTHTQLRYTTRHLTSHHHLNPGLLWTPTPFDICFVFCVFSCSVCCICMVVSYSSKH